MAKSAKDAGLTVNGTVKEMMELQMKGGLISEKVLPHFARNMSAAARANGGLEKAMNSNRVAMNRMMFSFQEAGNIIFKSGFGEGLTELFNAMAESVVKLKPLWEALGKISGSVFRLIAKGVKWVTPMFVSMGEVLNSITKGLGESYAFLMAMTGPAFYIYKKFGSKALKALPIVGQMLLLLDVIKQVAFWAEEVDNLLFSRNKIGLLYDPRQGVNAARVTAGGGAVAESYINTVPVMSEVLKWIDKNTLGAVGLPTFFSENYQMKGKQPVQVIIGADAEKMGITVSQAPAVQDMVASKIKEVQG